MPVVNVEQFVNIVEMSFHEGNRRPIFGLGKGGIGKTESIAELAKRLKIGYVDIRLLLYAETDLKGIPYPSADHMSTIWLQNNILPTVEKDGQYGILVLDEITSVSRSVRTAAYQLLNERKLGEYKVPDGWMIVCLGNGEEDGGDFQGMEGNFVNRCSVFNVVPNLDAWKMWAYNHGVNYMVLGYVSWMPSHLHTYDPNSETDMLFASPRSWNAVSDILNAHPFDEKDIINQLRVIANLGSLVGNQFIAFCKYKDSAVEPSDILSGKQVKEITSQEVLFMTMQGVVKLMIDTIKYDEANFGRITQETFVKCANGFKWILGLRAMEHRVMGIKNFASADISYSVKFLLNPVFRKMCPELEKFSSENRVVFKA